MATTDRENNRDNSDSIDNSDYSDYNDNRDFSDKMTLWWPIVAVSINPSLCEAKLC